MAGSGSTKKAKGLPKRAGRKTGAPKRARYFIRVVEKKIRRVLKHNGLAAAHTYADKKGALSTLRRIQEEKARRVA